MIYSLYQGSISENNDELILLDPITQTQIQFVKLYGTIIDKTIDAESNNSMDQILSLLIDDGTGSIWIKATNSMMTNIDLWDYIRVIGILELQKENDSEIRLVLYPEAIIPIQNKIWELIHRKETQRGLVQTILINSPPSNDLSSQTSSEREIFSTETKIIENKENKEYKENKNSSNKKLAEKIENLLRKLDIGDGVEFKQLVNALGNNIEESIVDDILFELAYEGKVYQPRPEYYKLME